MIHFVENTDIQCLVSDHTKPWKIAAATIIAMGAVLEGWTR